MLAKTEPAPRPCRPIQGRHVLACLVAFFGVVFAVNGVFLYQALSTYTGVVSAEPYRKGLNYNARIEDERRQDALGWRETMSLANSGALSLVLRDGENAAVGGLRIAAVVGRPSTNASDRRLTLVETAPGQYAASAGTLEPGAWLVTIEAQDADARIVYRLRNRTWLTPSTP